MRTRLATEQISSRIVMRMAGFHFSIGDASLIIRGFNYHSLIGLISLGGETFIRRSQVEGEGGSG